MKKYKHNFPKDRYVICAEYLCTAEKKVLSSIVDQSDIDVYYETREGINAEYYPYLCYDPRNEIIVGYRVPETHFIQVSFEEFLAYIKGEGCVAKTDAINHPKQYGGQDNPFEVIKIIEYYNLGFHLGNVLKYILRDKGSTVEDLKKGAWYIDRKIKQMEK